MQLAHMIWMQVFLHSKFHQIWVYLHFPLHLCQIAFGIELVNMLKLYRAELIDDGYLSSSIENGTTKASSEGGKTDTEAYNLARRAIEAIPTANESYVSSNSVALDDIQPRQRKPMSLAGYFTLFKYAASTTALATLQGLSTDGLLSASPLLDQNQMSTETTHTYARRAPGESGLKNDYTTEEMVFIYKLFLIMGGLLLVLNSLIKLINTRISGKRKDLISTHAIDILVIYHRCLWTYHCMFSNRECYIVMVLLRVAIFGIASPYSNWCHNGIGCFPR